VTAAAAFKRLGITIAAVLLGVLAIIGIVALLIPADRVREAVSSEIRSVTGLDLALRGDVSVSLFPTGLVTFTNVKLGDEAEPALSAERLTARLRFFPLFAGRIEISDVGLEQPRINVAFDPEGRSNWAELVGRLGLAFGPKANRPAHASSFSEIRVSRGTIVLRDQARGISETLRDVELALAWPSISRSFAVTGRLVWHDEPIDVSVALTDFASALAGERSGL
jgi:AsmA protein